MRLDDIFLGWSVKITILTSMKWSFKCSYMVRPNSMEPIANKGILQIKSTASVGAGGLGLWIFNCGPLTTGLDGAYLWIWASLMTVMMMIRMQISIFTSLFIVFKYFAQSLWGQMSADRIQFLCPYSVSSIADHDCRYSQRINWTVFVGLGRWLWSGAFNSAITGEGIY